MSVSEEKKKEADKTKEIECSEKAQEDTLTSFVGKTKIKIEKFIIVLYIFFDQ